MAGSAILEVKPDRVLDVFKGFFIRCALRVTSLKGGAVDKIARPVFFNHDLKHEFLHHQVSLCYSQVYGAGRLLSTRGHGGWLERGSTLYLDASIPHTLKNVTRRPAKCLSVVTPPVL